MFTCGPAFYQTPAGGSTDPDYASVVLLLHGSDFLDYSPHAFVATTIGGGVTLDSSVPNGTVGNSCFRVTGVGTTTFQFPAVPEFKRSGAYTLEYWVYFDAVASNNLAMCSNFGAKFVQFTNGSPFSNVGAQGYSPNAPNSVTIGAWHQITMAFDGSNYGQFFDGVSIFTGAFALPPDASDQDMDVISALGTGGQHRMMEIRYTQGVCRYNPLGTTVPVQTAPWPDS